MRDWFTPTTTTKLCVKYNAFTVPINLAPAPEEILQL